jgi:glycosyltransferase involved in cell wall biosynthesis
MTGWNRPRVCLITPHLVQHDAIGNDVLGMAECLRRSGYRVTVYAETVQPELISVADQLDSGTDPFWRSRETLLIYHHSMGWPLGQSILERASCRIVIKHHNVTPPRFFRPYSYDYAVSCQAGQRATEAVALTSGALFWADSEFNAEDLVSCGTDTGRCRILPPFHRIERLAESAVSRDVIYACKQHRGAKLLFVGGLKPNKGHAKLIQALAAYSSYADPDAILLLPGSCDSRLSNYTAALRQFAANLGVESRVRFVGAVDDSQLRAYYFSADVFLCLSEHEGFCVPLLEAMHFRTPIVTHNTTAIPETVGGAGLVWEENELPSIVESIAVCAEHDDRSRTLAAAGFQRYSDHYSPQRIQQKFLSLVEEAFQA